MANEKKSYQVVTPVDYNNRRYEAGKPITLSDEDAAPLLAAKAIREAEVEADKAKK